MKVFSPLYSDELGIRQGDQILSINKLVSELSQYYKNMYFYNCSIMTLQHTRNMTPNDVGKEMSVKKSQRKEITLVLYRNDGNPRPEDDEMVCFLSVS